MTQIEILKKKIQEAEAIIVGGASGLSAAAGFRFYYMNDATFKQIAVSVSAFIPCIIQKKQ